MRKSAKPSAAVPIAALAVLGLEPGASPREIKAAFRTAVKAARPDREGGDPERFRQVIEAYRLLQSEAAAQAAPETERPKPEPELEISVDEAFEGVARTVDLAGVGEIGVRLPAGLRTGDVVLLQPQGRGEPVGRRIRIVSEPDRAVVGDDLWLTLPVDRHLLQDGGRLEVDTPYGPRSVWAPRGLPKDAMLKVRDCGLPARDGHPQGHAFLKLKLDAARTDGIARLLLERFTAAWTPDVADEAARNVG